MQVINFMTLNIYGWKTMPQSARTYADFIKEQGIDILAVQEGADDWKIPTQFPSDYSRAIALANALGECWTRHFQIFVNSCSGVAVDSSYRFDLPNGPNATRTGEVVSVRIRDIAFNVINVHWDHQSHKSKQASANVTAQYIKPNIATIVLGDFNANCRGTLLENFAEMNRLSLAAADNIDCIFVSENFRSVFSRVLKAEPSDHNAVSLRVGVSVNQT
ncbi:endonuclease/exonuclease/phosphatase family protein [Catenovulum sp. SX2]|uniref:endonuclease/exonuclease/phosphatase family protein n=1 Tax=Catenovulum sp. SX2 TaxID=3398614 RepID=UPI003F831DA5